MSVPSTGWVPVDGGATREVGLSMSSEIGPSRGGWRGRIRGSFHGVGPSPDGAARERGNGETAARRWWRARLDSRAREVGSRVGDGIRLGWATKKFPSHRAFCAAAPLTSPSITHPQKE